MTWYRDYQSLFSSCIGLYDGTITTDGKLANLATPGSYHGTLSGVTTGQSNKQGIAKGLSLSGAGSITIGSVGSVKSVLFFHKPGAMSSSGFYLVSSSNCYLDWSDVGQYIYDANWSPTIYVDGAAINVSSYRQNSTSTWYCVVCTVSSAITASAVVFGAAAGSYSAYTGIISHIGLFSATLSAAEVAAISQLIMNKRVTPLIPNAEGRLIV